MSPEDLRIVRQTLGFSRKELAERLGLVERTISKWETGENPIKLWVPLALERLAQIEGKAKDDPTPNSQALYRLPAQPR